MIISGNRSWHSSTIACQVHILLAHWRNETRLARALWLLLLHLELKIILWLQFLMAHRVLLVGLFVVTKWFLRAAHWTLTSSGCWSGLSIYHTVAAGPPNAYHVSLRMWKLVCILRWWSSHCSRMQVHHLPQWVRLVIGTASLRHLTLGGNHIWGALPEHGCSLCRISIIYTSHFDLK